MKHKLKTFDNIVLEHITNGVEFPAELIEATERTPQAVSRSLNRLTAAGLIECYIQKQDKRKRLYKYKLINVNES